MVRAKKYLGQHFLKDPGIAQRITASLQGHGGYGDLLEIGPGTGILTRYLIQQNAYRIFMIDIDRESIAHLKKHYGALNEQIILGDFLTWSPQGVIEGDYGIIGNFPYHISSQIFFKILETPKRIPEVVCMLQKQVAERLAAPPGNRKYGILSVLLQAYYRVEYLFEVGPESFIPPPKVDSAVIRLQTLNREALGCDEVLFRRLVKQGFQNRRKTLRNALKPFNLPAEVRSLKILDRRAEQLTVEEYISLSNIITPFWNL